MKAKLLSTLILLLASLPPQATAECKFIGLAIREKIEDYKAFRGENLATLNSLLTTEKQCLQRGAIFSSKLAIASAGLTCEVQKDIARMDQEMVEIGTRCESTFQMIHQIQLALRTRFQESSDDIDAGIKVMKESQILQENCGPEIKHTMKLAKMFEELGMDIVTTEARSVDGSTNYGKFKEIAKQLHQLASARGAGCGNDNLELIGNLAKIVAKTQGNGAPVPSGKHPQVFSDVTGTDKEKSRLDSSSEQSQKLSREFAHEGSGPGGESAISGVSPKLSSARTGGTIERGRAALEGARSRKTAALLRLGELAPLPGAAASANGAHTLISAGAVLWQESEESADSSVGLGRIELAGAEARSSQASRSLASSNPIETAAIVPLGELSSDEVAIIREAQEGDIFRKVRRCYQRLEIFQRSQIVHTAEEAHPPARF